MDLNKKAYDKIFNSWDEARCSMQINNCIVDFVSIIKPNGKVLDIGCGTGYPISKFLSDKGFYVTGIDISSNMLSKANKLNLPYTSFILSDFFSFETKEKFDAVIAFDTFFHFPKEKQDKIYSKLSSLMNKDAYLLFTHGKKDDEIYGKMFDEVFYYSSLSVSSLKCLLIENGFEIILLEEDYYEKTTGNRDLLVVAKKIN